MKLGHDESAPHLFSRTAQLTWRQIADIYNAKHGRRKKKMTPGNAFMTHMRGMKKLRELLKNQELMA